MKTKNVKSIKFQKDKWYLFTWKKKQYYGKICFYDKRWKDIGVISTDFKKWNLYATDFVRAATKR